MAHSTVVVYIHFVWTTKDRRRCLVNDHRHRVRAHIEEYASQNAQLLREHELTSEQIAELLRLQSR